MAVYSITYDLIKDKDYTKLIDAIKRLSGSWANPTLSQWLVESSSSSSEIRDLLQSYVDNDDILFVAKIDMPKWATLRVDKEVTNWLHQHADS